MANPGGHGVRPVAFAPEGEQVHFEKQAVQAGPMQGARELTVNAVEAHATEVAWDYDWELMARDGLAKLCIVDNGIGMTAAEMAHYIGNVGASGKQLARTGNLGAGAKIACALANPLGVQYRSWKTLQSGVEGQFGHYDGQWGMRTTVDTAGHAHATWRTAEDRVPEVIAAAGHGTLITLWGETRDQDTFQAPASVTENRARWLVRYLNQRFFTAPAEVKIRVRDGAQRNRDGIPNGALTDVVGHRVHLQRRAIAQGSLRLRRRDGALSNARIHWWILDDDVKGRRLESTEWVSSGHVAGLWQGELYTLEEPTRGGYTTLQNFGIRHGYERVALIVEPLGRVESDTARSRLMVDELELPWSRWQDEFARQMPEEIRELMRALARAGTRVDLRESVAQRIRQAPPGFFELPRYRRPRTIRAATPGHRQSGAPVVVTSHGVQEVDQEEAARRAQRNRERDGKRGARKELPVDHEAVLETLPAFDWVSVRDGTRSIGELEDLALRYDERNHRLQINRDFRGFRTLFDHFLGAYDHVPGAGELIEQTVREEIAYVAFETVQWAVALSHSSARSHDSRRHMLSPESLTVGLTPRLIVHAKLFKLFQQRLGAATEPADAKQQQKGQRRAGARNGNGAAEDFEDAEDPGTRQDDARTPTG